MAKNKQNKEFTDRDKAIYKAAAEGKVVKTSTDDEKTIYEAGLNTIQVELAKLQRENKSLSTLLEAHKKSYADLCFSMGKSHHHLMEILLEKDREFPVFDITMPIDEARDLLDVLKKHNYNNQYSWRIKKLLDKIKEKEQTINNVTNHICDIINTVEKDDPETD